MNWIDLGNPVPRERPKQYTPFAWVDGKTDYLPPPSLLPTVEFADVIAARRSRTDFGRLSQEALSKLLWLSCRVQQTGTRVLGFPLTRRPVSSAGAIHPIHLLIHHPEDHGLLRYVPESHAVVEVAGNTPDVDEIRHTINQIVFATNATILFFVAEPGKTAAKYENAFSLIWRDAGVLLGHLALVAQAVGLHFCAIGKTGDPWASSLDQEGRLVGVGMALVGAPLHH